MAWSKEGQGCLDTVIIYGLVMFLFVHPAFLVFASSSLNGCLIDSLTLKYIIVWSNRV